MGYLDKVNKHFTQVIFEVREIGNYGLGMWLSSMNKATFEQKAGNQPRHGCSTPVLS